MCTLNLNHVNHRDRVKMREWLRVPGVPGKSEYCEYLSEDADRVWYIQVIKQYNCTLYEYSIGEVNSVF